MSNEVQELVASQRKEAAFIQLCKHCGVVEVSKAVGVGGGLKLFNSLL